MKFVIGGALTILSWDDPVTAFFGKSKKLRHSLGRPSRSDFVQCGFIGVPLGYALFGNIGVIYATVFVAVFHIFCWTRGIMLLDKGGFQLKKLINPCLIAVIAGMVFFIFQIRLSESIDFAMGAMTITMAIMYERDDHYATELFTVTTLLSILTMPLCMLIAG